MKRKLMVLSFMLLLVCCTQIRYQVSARKDPSWRQIKGSKTYAVKPNKNADDTIIDKKILFLISRELEKLGWHKSSLDNADYVFSVKFEMEGTQVTKSGSVPIKTRTYDYQTGKWTTHVTQRAYSNTSDLYERKITIIVTSKLTDSEIWSADCISKGKTQDILFASKYMVPYAISKFPAEGIWKQKEIVQ